MGIFEKMLAMANTNLNYNQKLYRLIKDRKYSQEPFHKEDLCEQMSCICEGYSDFILTRYLINHQLKEAYEVFDSGLAFLKQGDIDSEIENGLLGIYPPILINRYDSGMALFEWNTVEDGRAWVDEDGYGMLYDDPRCLYGIVNQRLEVICRFRYIDDANKINEYRRNPKQFLIDFPTSLKVNQKKKCAVEVI